MKTLLASVFGLLACLSVSAQVSMDLALDQQQFLPNEPIRLAVKITNTSGQELRLGTDPAWLTFNVESDDGFVVGKIGDVPVVDPFELESSMMGTKKVDLEPYFELGRPGIYKVSATLRVKEWSLAVNSSPIQFEIVSGVELWSQGFGVATATNAPPEPRKFVLMKANYLRDQMRLYAEVISGDGSHIFKVSSLGPMVLFGSPEAQVDRFSRLHVLWQTGAQSFSYLVMDAGGAAISRDIYDNPYNFRPRLVINNNGDVMVRGGVKRAPAGAAAPLPAPSTSPVAPAKP